jgi:ATP-binding cassette subfamily D (ALD) protein 3
LNRVNKILTHLALEGEFRACHSDLIAHAEEIAFYKGNKWEEKRVNERFNKLIKHIKSVHGRKFYMGIFDSMAVKYGAVLCGYTILGLPVFQKGGLGGRKMNPNELASNITKDYIKNSSLLINLAKV